MTVCPLQTDSEGSEEPPDWAQAHSSDTNPTSFLTLYKQLYFVLLAFLVGISTTLAWRATDGIFFAKFGSEALFSAYLIAAAITAFLGLSLVRIISSISPSKLFIMTLVTGLCFFIGSFSFLGQLQAGAIDSNCDAWLLFKVVNHVFSILAASSFWIFYDHAFPRRPTTKEYALVCTGLFLGTGFAGFLMIWYTANVSHYLYFQLATTALALLLASMLYAKLYTKPTEHATRIAYNDHPSLRSYLRELRKSKWAFYSAIITCFLFFLSTTAEYTYLYTFEEFLLTTVKGGIGDSIEAPWEPFASRSFTSCCAFVGFGNVVSGLFVYGRCFLPIPCLLIATPLIGLLLIFCMPISTCLLYPAMGMIVIDGLYPIIEDNNINSLVGPLPTKMKTKVRLLVETMAEPFGMLFSSLLFAATSADQSHVIPLVALFVAAAGVSLWIGKRRLASRNGDIKHNHDAILPTKLPLPQKEELHKPIELEFIQTA